MERLYGVIKAFRRSNERASKNTREPGLSTSVIIGFWPVREVTGPRGHSACSDEVNRDLLQQNDLLTATGKTQCLAPTVEFIPTLG